MSAETLVMIFDQYDVDEVGYLDRVTFEQFLVELGRADIPPDQLERCFSIVDRNGDGRVTKDNFVRYVPYLYEVDFDPPQRIRKKTTESTKSGGKKTEFRTKPGDPATFFTKVKKLGKGSYGVVYKAIDVRSDEIVALKIVDIEGNEEMMEDVQREVSFMANCNSPYVVKYFGSYLRGSELWIAMELVSGGSVRDMLQRQPIAEPFARIILRAIVKGLAYLHSENKMHRDIKAANVLLTSEGDVKLADFGVAASLYATVAVKNTFAGTPLWMAPEVIQQKPQTYAVDIWSLGITAIEIAQGVPPKADMHPMQVLFSVPEDPAPTLDGAFSDEFKSFVATCLAKDPAKRPPARALLAHPFLTTPDKTSLVELILQHEQLDAAQQRLSRMSMAIDQEIKELQASRPASLWDFSDAGAGDEDGVVTREEEAKRRFEPSMIDPDSELGVVLQRLQMMHLAVIFKENDIDLDAFLLLNDSDLKDMGVTLGNRKKLLHMIPILRRELGFAAPDLQATVKDADAAAAAPAAAHAATASVRRSVVIAPAAAEPTITAASVASLPLPSAATATQWTVQDVGRWLHEQGLAAHVQAFLDNQIDGEALRSLELDSLRELGLKLVGERVKFLASVAKLFRPALPQTSAPGSAPPKEEDGYYSDGESIIENASDSGSTHEREGSESDAPSAPFGRRGSAASTASSRKGGASRRHASFAKKPVDPAKRAELQQVLTKLQEQAQDDASTAAVPASKKKTAVTKKKNAPGPANANAAKLELPAPNLTAEDLKTPTHAGWLMKQGGQHKNWKKRWMVLQGCVLYYFKQPKGSKAKGAIMLPSYNLWIAGEIRRKFAFKLQHVSARTYYFQASNYEDMKTWMNALHAGAHSFSAGMTDSFNALLTRQSTESETVHSSEEEE